jgi:hypothetical protein
MAPALMGLAAPASYGVIAAGTGVDVRCAALTEVVAFTRARTARRLAEPGQQPDALEPPGRRCGC